MTAFIVFIAASPAIFAPYGQNGGYSPDLHISSWIQVLVVLALTLYIYACAKRRSITYKAAPTHLPAVLLVSWAAVSMIWATEKYNAFFTVLNWMGALLAGLLIVLVIRTPRARRQLLIGIAVSGFLIALLGIAQYLFAADLVTQYIAPSGTFNNKNMLGQFCVLIFPVAVMLMAMEKNTAKGWVYAVFTTALAATIYYTHAKGSWLAFVTETFLLVSLFLYLGLRCGYRPFADRHKKTMACVVVVSFIGLSYLTPLTFSTPKEIRSAAVQTNALSFARDGVEVARGVVSETGSSGEIRFIMWRNSMGMFLEHMLLGVGIGNWTNSYDAYQSYYRQDYKILENKYHVNAHNDYVEILCELGLIGAVLFLWLVIALLLVVQRVLSLFGKGRVTEEAPLMTGLIVGLVGIGICALVSFPFKQPISIMLTAVYIAILSSVYVVLTPRPARTLVLPSRNAALTIAGVCMAATIALTYLHHNWYVSERGYRMALFNYMNGKYQTSLQHANEALQYNGLRAQLKWLYAINLMYVGRVHDALPWFHAVLRSNTHSPATLHSMATAYSALQDYRKAAGMLDKLYEVQDQPRLLRKQAEYLNQGGHHEESVAKLQQLRMRLIGMKDHLDQSMEGGDGVSGLNKKLAKLAVLIAKREAQAREKENEAAIRAPKGKAGEK